MAKNPARNPKVTRRQRATSAGPKGSLRKAAPKPSNPAVSKGRRGR